MEARVFHHQSPARWQRRSKAEEEERRRKRLEVQVISAQKLAKVHVLKKTKAYALAWMDMHQDAKLRTDVDRKGGRNPTWNKVLSFSAAEAEELVETLGTNAALNVEIYSKSWLRDKLVGTVRVLLVDLLQGIPDKGKCFTFMVVRPSGRRKGLLNVGVRPEKAFYDDELVLYSGPAASATGAAAAAAASAPAAADADAAQRVAVDSHRVAAPTAADAARQVAADSHRIAAPAAARQSAADSHRIAARLQQLHIEMDLSRTAHTDASLPAPDSVASRDHRQHAPFAGTAQPDAAASHQVAARLPHTNVSRPAPDSIASGDHRQDAPGTVQRVTAGSHRIAARLQHTNASPPPAPDSIASRDHRAPAGVPADAHRIAARLQQLHAEMDLSRKARRKASRPALDSRASGEHVPSAPPFHGYVD